MAAADWMPIPNRHGRLMARLRDQRRVDPYGGIGWDGLREDREVLTNEQRNGGDIYRAVKTPA